MTPFFSIIIPTFNRAQYLSDTIRSVLDQQFQNWECIVVDDGSVDDTKAVVESFQDSRIIYFYKNNEERSIARNFGIEQAKGQYVCFLDSDDIYYSNHLAVLGEKIQNENYPIGMFYTGVNEKRGDKITSRPTFDPQSYSHPVYFVWEKFMLINSVCVHHKVLKENEFPKEFNVWEDTHLWLRIAAAYPFYQIDKVTTQWNFHRTGSVYKAFEKVEVTHVKNYLMCVNDLFSNYEFLLKPFLKVADKNEYQFKKLKMFMKLSFSKGEFRTFFKLYLLGIRFIKFSNLNAFAVPLVLKGVKKRLQMKLKSS